MTTPPTNSLRYRVAEALVQTNTGIAETTSEAWMLRANAAIAVVLEELVSDGLARSLHNEHGYHHETYKEILLIVAKRLGEGANG